MTLTKLQALTHNSFSPNKSENKKLLLNCARSSSGISVNYKMIKANLVFYLFIC